MKEKLIFVVDDDKIIQNFIEYSIIGREGYTAKVFSRAEDCINNLDKNPDCIILDHYYMGKFESLMTGLEALVKIRDVNKAVPVIILSNNTDKELISTYIEKGATSYILKEGYFINNLWNTFDNLTLN
jgi:CheY-like chemotaxis protein